MRYVVTLVHGTFAHAPEQRQWTLAGSRARESLKAVLQSDGRAEVEITEPFVWSGKNQHRHRLQAGRALAARLRNETRRPGDRRVLVGHSHGGNVTLYALRELVADGEEELVDGVVCLATPHLSASVRPLKDSFRVLGFQGAVLAVLVYFLLSCVALGLWWGDGEVGVVSGAVALLLFLSLRPAFRLVRSVIEGPLRKRVRRLAKAKADEIGVEVPPKTPLLSLNVAGDEALAGLRLAGSAAASPVSIWRLLTRLAAPFGVLAFWGFFLLPDPGPGVILGPARKWLLIAAFLGPVASLLLIWILSLLRLPTFGIDEALVVRTCVAVGVSARPAGFEAPRCEQRTFRADEIETELRGMAHAKPYRSRKILNYAAEWILEALPPRP